VRVVFSHRPGVYEVRWMFLPTFIGQNVPMMKQLETELTKTFVGRPAEDSVLDEVHEYVLNWIAKKFPLNGIRQYLEGISFVREE
jgi:hypothetical protein